MRRYFIRDILYVLNSRISRKNSHKKSKTKLVIVITLMIFLLLFSWLLSFFETKVMPMVSTMAESRAKVIALIAINEGIREEIVKKIEYEDLITLKKDENQRITALQTNMVKMNEMQALTSHVIQNKISSINESELKIPIGNLFNSSLLAGMGPKIKIKIIPFGSIQSRFVDEFVSAGINQTKHKINLEFNASIVVIAPLGRIATEVVSSVPIAETIIVGDVPITYLNTKDGGIDEKSIGNGLATKK